VFLLELNRLCNEIQKNLPEIHTAFSPEKMEETIRVYSIEARKDRPQGRMF
jgi:hypothetical protein